MNMPALTLHFSEGQLRQLIHRFVNQDYAALAKGRLVRSVFVYGSDGKIKGVDVMIDTPAPSDGEK